MRLDDDPALKAAFAKLHERQAEKAPSFAAMRAEAMRKSAEPVAARQSWSGHIAWLAGACALALFIWWMADAPKRETPPTHEAATRERAEEIIAAIEQHLEGDEMPSELPYPSDLLLVGNENGFSP